MRLVSIGTMISQISGLVGTTSLSDWETGFVKNVALKTNDGRSTTDLSTITAEKVEEIWKANFS